MRYLRPIFKFSATFVKQQKLKCARLTRRLEVGSLFAEPLAELCVHRRVLRLVQGFLKNEKDDALEDPVGVQFEPEEIIAQLLKFLRRELVENTTNLHRGRPVRKHEESWIPEEGAGCIIPCGI